MRQHTPTTASTTPIPMPAFAPTVNPPLLCTPAAAGVIVEEDVVVASPEVIGDVGLEVTLLDAVGKM